MRKPIGQFPAMRSLLSDFFETDKLGFDDYFRKDWMPAVNVKDGKDQYEIEVAAPGLKKEDFKIRVEHGILTISSNRSRRRKRRRASIRVANSTTSRSQDHSRSRRMSKKRIFKPVTLTES